MKDITYKYNVGDYVKFKDKFSSPTCGLVGREGTIAKITGHAFAYNNKPHYYINGDKDVVFPETVFERLATMADLRAQNLKMMKQMQPKAEAVEVGSLLGFTEAVLEATKEVYENG